MPIESFADGKRTLHRLQWEILGDLALRLQHKEEAKDAYQRCLDSKFSAKSWQKLLETYADEGDLQKTLNAATRLTTYNWRWYTESCYPTAVGASCCPSFLLSLSPDLCAIRIESSPRDLQDRSGPRPLEDCLHAAVDGEFALRTRVLPSTCS